VPETARTEKPRKSKIEKRLPKRLNIGAAEVGPNSLYLWVEIESTDNQQKYGVRALVDSGAICKGNCWFGSGSEPKYKI
jgi:hypothetical protein